jgi:hypothetical protein
LWSITALYVKPGVMTMHGTAESKEDAKAAFAKTLRDWLNHVGAEDLTKEVLATHQGFCRTTPNGCTWLQRYCAMASRRKRPERWLAETTCVFSELRSADVIDTDVFSRAALTLAASARDGGSQWRLGNLAGG